MHPGMKSFVCRFASFWCLAFAAQAASPIAGPITNIANGHVYFLLSADTWPNAETAARALGGHLTTINDAAEDRWVYSTFSSWGDTPRLLWIGLSDAATEGRFLWVSGDSAAYRNWAPSEPNNLGANEHHVCYFPPNETFREKWNDANGGALLHGVVEIPEPYRRSSLAITVRTVHISMSVTPGSTFLLENSADMVTWAAVEPSFVADSPLIERDVDVLNGRRFFRLKESDLTNGLVAAYDLNGDANDSSGRNNHGAVTAASNTTNRFGLAGRALQFNGTNTYVAIPDSDAFDSPDYTVSLWFRADDLPSPAPSLSDATFLLSKGRNNFELHLGSAISGRTGIRFLPRLVGALEPLWDTDPDSYQRNTWHHLVAIYQPSANTVRIFRDGQPLSLAGADSVVSAPDNTAEARLGMRSDGNYPFKGALDNVRIYSRALTEAEVLVLFHHPN